MKNINLKAGDILEVLKNKRTFTRAVWYIIISVIAVALITSLLVWYYSGSVLGQYQYDAVNNYQKSVLLAAENTNNQFPKAIMQIFSDTDISRCLRDGDLKETEKAAAVRKMEDYLFYYNVNFIQIIHERSNSYWTSDDCQRRSFDENNDETTSKILEMYKSGRNLISASELNLPERGIYYIHKNFQDYTFILNINENEYKKSILQYASPFKCNTWIYYNNNPSITDSEEIFDVVSKYGLKTEPAVNNSTSVDNMFFVSNRSGNYTVVTMISEPEYRKDIYRNIFVLVVVALIIILICIVSLVIHTKYFSIMKRIYDEKMDEAKNKFEIGTWQNIVYKIFVGVGLSAEERSVVEKITGGPGISKYLPMLILADNVSDKNAEELRSTKADISRIINDLFDDMPLCCTVSLEKERIGVIVCLNNTEFDIRERLNAVVNKINEDTGVTISIVAETPDTDCEYIEDKVVELFKIAQYHFISGPGNIIISDELSDINIDAGYPSEIEQNIALALKGNDEDALRVAYDEFKNYIKDSNYLMGRKWSVYLYTNIMSIFMGEDVGESELNGMNFSNIEEIFENLKTAAQSAGSDEGEDFKLKVQELVELNYMNSDYSISDIAESAGINTVYAGQKFKKTFDKTFNAYLAEYRCKKAAELLTQTDKKSIEIASLCGFKSDTYYNYIFKKYMKSTPQQYRKAYKKI